MATTTATKREPTGPLDGRGEPTAPSGRLRRRPLMGLLFAGLALLGAVLGALVLSAVTSSTEVVAIRADVERGRVIAEPDLMVVRISLDPELRVVPAAGLAALVGKRAAADLTAGTLLAPDQVTDAAVPVTGFSLVGLALAPGSLPNEPLHAGDRVRVIPTEPVVQGAEVAAPASPVDGTVVSVSAAGPDGQTVVVDVSVASANAPVVARAAANGGVALVLDSRER